MTSGVSATQASGRGHLLSYAPNLERVLAAQGSLEVRAVYHKELLGCEMSGSLVVLNGLPIGEYTLFFGATLPGEPKLPFRQQYRGFLSPTYDIAPIFVAANVVDCRWQQRVQPGPHISLI